MLFHARAIVCLGFGLWLLSLTSGALFKSLYQEIAHVKKVQ